MKDLVKKQDKFIDEIFTCPSDNTLCYLTGDDKRRIMKLISKVRKETAEFERERILKALPEEISKYWVNKEIKRMNLKTTKQLWAIRATREGFNNCLRQAKQILK